MHIYIYVFIQHSQNHEITEMENRLVVFRGQGLESRLERQKGDGCDYRDSTMLSL